MFKGCENEDEGKVMDVIEGGDDSQLVTQAAAAFQALPQELQQ